MPTRTASARWLGTLTEGSGTVRTGMGGYQGPYSFSSRFAEGEGTNPEELIGAAHAACFAMALSKVLTDAGYPPTSIETTANVQLEKGENGYSITRIHLNTTGTVPGIDDALFQKSAEGAKENCPVSRALAGVEITQTARLA